MHIDQDQKTSELSDEEASENESDDQENNVYILDKTLELDSFIKDLSEE